MIEQYMIQDMTELLDGIGIILINLLMLEQMHKMQQEQKRRKGDWVVCTLLALCGMTTFRQFLYHNMYSVWWSVPVNAAVLFVYALLAERMRPFLAGKRTAAIVLLFSVTILLAEKFPNTGDGQSEFLNQLVLYFLFFMGSIWLLQKGKRMFTRKEAVILLISIILSVGVLYYLLSLSEQVEDMILLYGCIAGILGIDGILVYLLIKAKQGAETERQYSALEQQYALQKQYMQSIYEMNEQARQIRHDLKHHISGLNALVNQQPPDIREIRRYLSQYETQTMLLQESVHTENAVVNAVLNAKLRTCKEQRIRTTVCIGKILEVVSEVDFCSLLGNLLDNAIEAEQKLPYADRKIEVQIQSSEAVMDIWVRNSIAESVLEKNADLQTTKDNTQFHGLGTKIIHKIVSKYEGYLDIYEEEGSFCCHIRIS